MAFQKKMRASVQENKTSETSHVSCMNNTAWKKSIVAYGLIAVQVTNQVNLVDVFRWF